MKIMMKKLGEECNIKNGGKSENTTKSIQVVVHI